VDRRMTLPENSGNRVLVHYSRQDDEAVFHITDTGSGFNWKPFLELDPKRAHAPCGRGIALARMRSFDSVEYRGNGNEVQVCVKVRPR